MNTKNLSASTATRFRIRPLAGRRSIASTKTLQREIEAGIAYFWAKRGRSTVPQDNIVV